MLKHSSQKSFEFFIDYLYLMKTIRVNDRDPHLIETISQVNIIHTIRRICRRTLTFRVKPKGRPPVKDHAAAAGHEVVAARVWGRHLVAVAFSDCQLYQSISPNKFFYGCQKARSFLLSKKTCELDR